VVGASGGGAAEEEVRGAAPARIAAGSRRAWSVAYGSYSDIDGLFQEQASELDPKRREASLHRIQQLMHEKVMVAPVWLNAGLNGVGPRVEESAIGLVPGPELRGYSGLGGTFTHSSGQVGAVG
jgi:hypothetical protein